jgi:hypothetical protein
MRSSSLADIETTRSCRREAVRRPQVARGHSRRRVRRAHAALSVADLLRRPGPSRDGRSRHRVTSYASNTPAFRRRRVFALPGKDRRTRLLAEAARSGALAAIVSPYSGSGGRFRPPSAGSRGGLRAAALLHASGPRQGVAITGRRRPRRNFARAAASRKSPYAGNSTTTRTGCRCSRARCPNGRVEMGMTAPPIAFLASRTGRALVTTCVLCISYFVLSTALFGEGDLRLLREGDAVVNIESRVRLQRRGTAVRRHLRQRRRQRPRLARSGSLPAGRRGLRLRGAITRTLASARAAALDAFAAAAVLVAAAWGARPAVDASRRPNSPGRGHWRLSGHRRRGRPYNSVPKRWLRCSERCGHTPRAPRARHGRRGLGLDRPRSIALRVAAVRAGVGLLRSRSTLSRRRCRSRPGEVHPPTTPQAHRRRGW